MPTLQLKVNAPGISGAHYEGTYDIPDTAVACIEAYTDPVCVNIIASRIKAVLGHKIRTWMIKGLSSAAIASNVAAWTPSARELSQKLSEEEKEFRVVLKIKDPAERKRAARALLKKVEEQAAADAE